ncbi:rhodanese-like domain-containing protein [Nitratidesulfovibrio sp.]|uniref:rhodanese-like domain-containing protein n=1 Tax=Nitratidesulfovibrio sp. TaxID=2802297 RepID=UPI00333EC73F
MLFPDRAAYALVENIADKGRSGRMSECAAKAKYPATSGERWTWCTAREAEALFAGTKELAVLDVREQGEFTRGHILLASCVPLSRLELLAEDLVPCRRTLIVLVDDGDEKCSPRAERAASRLADIGYSQLRVLKGGMRAWLSEGLTEVSGVGALSKGFGEYVESRLHTPALDPAEVKQLLEQERNSVIIDVRPRDEYTRMNIPGGINAPGCEVLYRFADLVPDANTTVIINCAGRTRSIIGTQTLLNAGVPNRVFALKGGTMNWRLSGLSLAFGTAECSAPPSLKSIEYARQRAFAIAEAFAIPFAEADEVHAWQKEADGTTLYLFDVRQPEEFETGHLPGSRNAPGGQLVQSTDEYAAVRNARFVLVDDTEIRAIMTAHWLKQMGLPHVYVLRGGLGGSGLGAGGLDTGTVAPACSYAPPATETIPAPVLAARLEAAPACLVINVGGSGAHRKGHIPRAAWVARGYLELAHACHPDATEVVVTSDTEYHARLAAADAALLWDKAPVRVLAGGNPAWASGGFPLATGMPWALCAEDDAWYRPYQDPDASPDAMHSYFDWEFGLVERIRKDGAVSFQLFEKK